MAVQECVHCHRNMGDMAGGFASYNRAPLCHPNAEGRPDCYRNVSVHNHEVEDCQDGCQDDPYDRPPVFSVKRGMCDVHEDVPGFLRDISLHGHQG